MEEMSRFPSPPPNFISLQKLQEQRIKEQEQKKRKKEEEDRLLKKQLEEEDRLLKKLREIKSNGIHPLKEECVQVRSKSSDQKSETPDEVLTDLEKSKKKKKQNNRKKKEKEKREATLDLTDHPTENLAESTEKKTPSLNPTVEIDAGDDNEKKVEVNRERSDGGKWQRKKKLPKSANDKVQDQQVSGERSNGRKERLGNPTAEIVVGVGSITIGDDSMSSKSTVEIHPRNFGNRGRRRGWGRGSRENENLTWVKKGGRQVIESNGHDGGWDFAVI